MQSEFKIFGITATSSSIDNCNPCMICVPYGNSPQKSKKHNKCLAFRAIGNNLVNTPTRWSNKICFQLFFPQLELNISGGYIKGVWLELKVIWAGEFWDFLWKNPSPSQIVIWYIQRDLVSNHRNIWIHLNPSVGLHGSRVILTLYLPWLNLFPRLNHFHWSLVFRIGY